MPPQVWKHTQGLLGWVLQWGWGQGRAPSQIVINTWHKRKINLCCFKPLPSQCWYHSPLWPTLTSAPTCNLLLWSLIRASARKPVNSGLLNASLFLTAPISKHRSWKSHLLIIYNSPPPLYSTELVLARRMASSFSSIIASKYCHSSIANFSCSNWSSKMTPQRSF